jgi:hypothetical protein
MTKPVRRIKPFRKSMKSCTSGSQQEVWGMKSIKSWTMQILGVLLLLTLAAGCFTGRWDRDYSRGHSGIGEDDRGWEGRWDSDRDANRDRDSWEAQQRSEGYSQRNFNDTH